MVGAMLLKLCSEAQAGGRPPTRQGPSHLVPSITHLDFVILHYTIGFAFACIFAKD